MPTRRLTVAQAIVRFLTQQHTSLDGDERPFFGGVLAIFGHGNVAGLGPALLEARGELRTILPRNEQAMVHTAVGYAKMPIAGRRSSAPARSAPARPIW